MVGTFIVFANRGTDYDVCFPYLFNEKIWEKSCAESGFDGYFAFHLYGDCQLFERRRAGRRK